MISRRIAVHFPGFEPLDASAHRNRFERTAAQSAAVWDWTYGLEPAGKAVPFEISAESANWQTRTRLDILEHNELIAAMRSEPVWLQILRGFQAFAGVTLEGGLWFYLKHAWRFCLFFLFPFLLSAFSVVVCAAMALIPLFAGLGGLHFLWSVALALLLFRLLFMPLASRFLTLHLFADWRLALAVSRQDSPALEAWLDQAAERLKQALRLEADEYLISSHSMGSSLAVQALGRVLEQEPELLAGKKVSFVTLGGAVLQCAPLTSAVAMRRRVGAIAANPDVAWLEVQCLTDIVNFYRTAVVELCGHEQFTPAEILLVRFKTMLTAEHYKKIKRDFLRVHRQFVLGPDRKSNFDFALMVAGPWTAMRLATALKELG